VKTRYPSTHQGIVIDELDIPKWLPERELSVDRLLTAARTYTTDSTADRLLRATVAAQAKTRLDGLTLFDALDRRAGGQLANWIGELAQDSRYTNTHPWHDLEEDDPAAAEYEAATLPPVVLHLLRELDPDGEAMAAGCVGLISFKDCVDAIGEALGVAEQRRLHFWGVRGSNQLADCTILLVIGTPTVHPDTVTRLARTLWYGDPQLIEPTPRTENGKITGYVDPRMQRLNDYLTRAELTQCAHRSRALRYKDRVVVTFCLGDIDSLPATETITDLPQLLAAGREQWAESRAAEHQKLDQALETLEQQGKTLDMISVRELRAVAGAATDAAADYLRDCRKARHAQDTPTPHQCSQTETSVPDLARDNPYSTTRYGHEMPPSRIVQPGTATTPPVATQPCYLCGHLNEWARDPDGQHWICRCYYWWYEHPEWRESLPIAV
jgi:hypothetical protein